MLRAAKSQSGYLPGKQNKQNSSQRSQEDRCSSQHSGGLRDPLCVVRTGCLGNLTYTTAVDAQTSNALGKVDDRSVEAKQSEPGGTKQNRHSFSTNDSDCDVHHGRAT